MYICVHFTASLLSLILTVNKLQWTSEQILTQDNWHNRHNGFTVFNWQGTLNSNQPNITVFFYLLCCVTPLLYLLQPWQLSVCSEPWQLSVCSEPWQLSVCSEPWQLSVCSERTGHIYRMCTRCDCRSNGSRNRSAWPVTPTAASFTQTCICWH